MKSALTHKGKRVECEEKCPRAPEAIVNIVERYPNPDLEQNSAESAENFKSCMESSIYSGNMHWKSKRAPRVGTLPLVAGVHRAVCHPRETFPSAVHRTSGHIAWTTPGQPTRVEVS